jgi:zeaxanthin glucosyltransferase
MTHFGIICPSTTGHINSIVPLGQELQRRGHQVTFLLLADAQSQIEATGIDFCGLGAEVMPVGTVAARQVALGKLDGLAAVRYTIDLIKDVAEIVLTEAPQAIEKLGITTLIVDQVSPEGATVAEYLKIPYITFCSALMLNRDPHIPPFMTTWEYNSALWAQLRNRLGYVLLDRLGKPLVTLINRYRLNWGLTPYQRTPDSYSTLVQISQQPAEFEYPRTQLPPYFHFTGPFHNATQRSPIEFPFNRLTGKPLIYVSMGSILNRQTEIFDLIAPACHDLPVQLVISLGNNISQELRSLPENSIVVPYAPQLEILKRATLMITHGGMNTTLECLTQGVPMVAIPITNDQPGVAARIAWSGAGICLPLKKLTTAKLRSAIESILEQLSYRDNARRLQKSIEQSGGVKLAADIVEKVAINHES